MQEELNGGEHVRGCVLVVVCFSLFGVVFELLSWQWGIALPYK